MEAQQVKPKMWNKTVLMHRVPQITRLINKTAAEMQKKRWQMVSRLYLSATGRRKLLGPLYTWIKVMRA